MDETLSSRMHQLSCVKTLANDCTNCAISKERRNAVFGSGNSVADVLVVGEAPGRNEDIDGLPFTGISGQLLTQMLSSIYLDRDKDCYLTNVIKCRPPDNRNPAINEIENCRYYLERQIELIKPIFIIAVGKFAAEWFNGGHVAITRDSGKLYDYRGTGWSPILHPAYILRNQNMKDKAWDHLKSIMIHLDKIGFYDRKRRRQLNV